MNSEEQQYEDEQTDISIVKGICDLLQQVNHLDIIRYAIKACTYISMNYKFIKDSKFSKHILQ